MPLRPRITSLLHLLTWARFSLVYGAVVVGAASCRLVPIQVTRVDAVLNYRQVYNMPQLKRLDPDGHREFGARLLGALLGERNFCNIQQGDRLLAVKGIFEQGDEWAVEGMATAVILPSPWSSDEFFIEVNGRYVVHAESDSERLVATADFYVENQSVHGFKDLLGRRSKGGLTWIDLKLREIVVREIATDRPRYVYHSGLVMRLYIKPLDRDGVFIIAPVQHEVGIVSSEDPNSVYSVGCLSFKGPMDGRKLFDVRGRGAWPLRDDYRAILDKAGIRQAVDPFLPHWYGASCGESEPLSGAETPAGKWTSDSDGDTFERLFPVPRCERYTDKQVQPEHHDQCTIDPI